MFPVLGAQKNLYEKMGPGNWGRREKKWGEGKVSLTKREHRG